MTERIEKVTTVSEAASDITAHLFSQIFHPEGRGGLSEETEAVLADIIQRKVADPLEAQLSEARRTIEDLEIQRDVANESYKDICELLPYCQDCADQKVGIAERLESCPICNLGPICERCMEQHKTDVHVDELSREALEAELSESRQALQAAREVMDLAEDGAAYEYSRCGGEAQVKEAIAKIDAALKGGSDE